MNTDAGDRALLVLVLLADVEERGVAEAVLGVVGLDLADAAPWRRASSSRKLAIVVLPSASMRLGNATRRSEKPTSAGPVFPRELRRARRGRAAPSPSCSRTTASAQRSNGVSSALRITRRAPALQRDARAARPPGTRRATCRRRGTRRRRAAASCARSRSSGTRFSPNEIVADFRMPPHSRQAGSSSPARTRSSVSSIGPRQPHARHFASRTLPWISTTISGDEPAAWCRPSTFWVTSVCSAAAPLELGERAVPGVGLARRTSRSSSAVAATPAGGPRDRRRSAGSSPVFSAAGPSSTRPAGRGSRGCPTRSRCPRR